MTSATARIQGIVLVVDFMNVLVRCYHAGQPSDIHAVRGMLDSVRKVCEVLNPSVLVFAGEGGHGYRRSLHPGYKSSRDEPEPELRQQVELAKQALDAIGWPLLSSPGAEADDVIATLAADLKDRADSVVVVSTDKDLQQLIGTGCQIYEPFKRKGFVRPEHVVERFGVQPSQLGDLLALAGDKSDDVPGVKGIGPKKAAGLLIEFQTLDRVLEEAAGRADDKAAMWRTLSKSIDDAKLSRKLVELQDNVPIAHGWEDWKADEPRLQWIDCLRDLGLGAAATRLGNWLRNPRRSETPLTELVSREPIPEELDDVPAGSCPSESGDQQELTDEVRPEPEAAPELERDATCGSAGEDGSGSPGAAPTLPQEVLRDAYRRGQQAADESPTMRPGAVRGQFGAGKNADCWELSFWAGVKGEPFPFESAEISTGGTLF